MFGTANPDLQPSDYACRARFTCKRNGSVIAAEMFMKKRGLGAIAPSRGFSQFQRSFRPAPMESPLLR